MESTRFIHGCILFGVLTRGEISNFSSSSRDIMDYFTICRKLLYEKLFLAKRSSLAS